MDRQLNDVQIFQHFDVPLTRTNRLRAGVLGQYGVNDRRRLVKNLRSRYNRQQAAASLVQRRARERRGNRRLSEAAIRVQRRARERRGNRRLSEAASRVQRRVRGRKVYRLIFQETDYRAEDVYGLLADRYRTAGVSIAGQHEISDMVMQRISATPLRRGERVSVILETSEGYTVGTKFMGRGPAIRERLTELINQLLQSDGLVTVTDVIIQYQRLPTGGAWPGVPDYFALANPKGLYLVQNDDDLCGQRALAMSLLSNDHYTKVNKGKRTIIKELNEVREVLGDKRLHPWEFKKWTRKKVVVLKKDFEVVWQDDKVPVENGVVYIYYDWVNEHYHYIRCIGSFINNTGAANASKYVWCEQCMKRIRREYLQGHKCEGNKCKCCWSLFPTLEALKCHAVRPEERKYDKWDQCPKCNIKSPNDECLEAHIAACKGTKWKCYDCKQWIPIEEKDSHNCDEKTCLCCKQKYTGDEKDHKCYVQTVKEKKDGVGKLWVYDFESRFEKSSFVTGAGKNRREVECQKHHVNLVVCRDGDNEDLDAEPLVFRSLPEFIEWVLKQKTATFIAHNAKAYDLWLIYNHLRDRTGEAPDNLVMAGNKVMYMTLRSLRFIDSLNHVAQALETFPKTFGFAKHPEFAKLRKGYYPYNFNTLENESYVGPMPPLELFEPQYKKPAQAAELIDWYRDLVNKSYVWNNWEELLEYCKDDVKVLTKGLQIYRKAGIETHGLDPLAYATIASYCMASYKINDMPEDCLKILTWEEYDFIKRDFAGGRTNAIKLQKSWTPKDLEEGRCGRYFDIQSLYPSVQFYDVLPAGQSMWVETGLEQLLHSKFNKGGGIGFYEVDIECPKDLYMPVLGDKKDGRFIFDCYDKDAKVVNSLELKKALDIGYKVTQWHRALVFEHARDDLFKSYVSRCLKVKVESSDPPAEEELDEFIRQHKIRFDIDLDPVKVMQPKNSGLRALTKICLNSLWGKFAESPDKTVHEYVKVPKRHWQLIGMAEEGVISDRQVTVIDNDRLMVTYKHNKRERTCLRSGNLALGAFVTANARLRLYTELEKLEDRILYFDTDSVVFEYDKTKYNIPPGQYLGEWECETDGRPITDFVALAPKSYSYKVSYGIEEHTKNKGFTLNVQNSKEINYERMCMLLKGEIKKFQTKNLDFRKKFGEGICSYYQDKYQVFDYKKRRVLEDGVSTLPWGYEK